MEVSVLACGTNMLQTVVQEQADTVLTYALDKGINLIVTSAAYRVIEPMVAEAVGDRRDEFHLATTTDHWSAKWARSDVENSLKVFRTDFIDIYQIGGISRPRGLELASAKGGAVEALGGQTRRKNRSDRHSRSRPTCFGEGDLDGALRHSPVLPEHSGARAMQRMPGMREDLSIQRIDHPHREERCAEHGLAPSVPIP